MSFREWIKDAWLSLKKRITTGLLIISVVSILIVVVLSIVSIFLKKNNIENDVFSVLYIVISTLATSIFAACIVSFIFDLKGIRDLIVKNDADLLLKMLLRSDELFSIGSDSGGEHKAILENIRLKSTAALNSIDLSHESIGESDSEMRRGHIRACLNSLDHEPDKAYAKYVNITRNISKKEKGVFKVDETIYVRYMNDTVNPKSISVWNELSSGILPASFSHAAKDTLRETIEISIDNQVPKLYEYKTKCEIIGIEGIDASKRNWKNQWEEDLRQTQVPPNGTCVLKMHRIFFIPEQEEISYRWNAVRSESKYEISYDGDDYEPVIHIVNCDKCDKTNGSGCIECGENENFEILKQGNTKVAVLKNWPNLNIGIRITWYNKDPQKREEGDRYD